MVPRLGVGLAYQPQLQAFMESRGDAFDFMEVAPERAWSDPDATAFLKAQARTRAVVLHGASLSIGSAHRLDREHLTRLARWHDAFPFPWHSDHLSFHRAEHEGELSLDLGLPLPLDAETLELLSSRVAEVHGDVPAPFLLQNNVSYFRLADQEYDEAAFLTALHRVTGCGVLLDLHALHANARNLGWDPYRFLDRLDLDAVVAVHVAGGRDMQGVYLDAHSGPAPRAVWELLDEVLPQCHNLAGVTFELGGSWYGAMGEDGLRRQLGRLRESWARYQPAAERRVA